MSHHPDDLSEAEILDKELEPEEETDEEEELDKNLEPEEAD